MSEEVKPSSASSTETTPEIEAPTDYREYVRWRQTGELAKKEEETPAVAEPAPPAKTEPQSGAEEVQPEEEEVEQGKSGRGGSRQRKIDRLTRDNELLRQQLAAVNQPRPAEAPPKAEPPKPAEAPVGKPKLHDFPTLEAYQEALTDWKIDQREAQKKAEAAQTEARTAEQKLQTEWSTRTEAARAALPDYDEVIQSTPYPVGPGVMPARQAMLEDEAGPQILYYLGTHPDELQKIAQMQPVSAVKEIGRLSAMFAQATPPAGKPKPRVSGAPPPPAPLSRPTAGSSTKNIYDEDFARSDFRAWEKERLRQLKG